MNVMTKSSFEKLKQELRELEKKRPQVIIDLNEARDQGDLSENAGYHAAKAELRNIDQRMSALSQIIGSAVILQATHSDFVTVGSYVHVFEQNSNSESFFRIVGEADLLDQEENGKITRISHASPVAKKLLNNAMGDIVEINSPAGQRIYKILAISVESF